MHTEFSLCPCAASAGRHTVKGDKAGLSLDRMDLWDERLIESQL